MKIAMAQLNTHLGDFKTNAANILKFSKEAVSNNCDVILFPECALFGYTPADLLERDSVVKEQTKVLNQLVKRLPSKIHIIFGAITHNKGKGKRYLNSAIVVHNQKIIKSFAKQLLPTYDVFDEERHFEAGDLNKNILKIGNKKIFIAICEDLWAWKELNPFQHVENPLLKFKGKVDITLALNASPFSLKKSSLRLKIARKCIAKTKSPIVYVNQVGGQDEIIFDGGSFALNKKGELIAQLPDFKEALSYIEVDQVKPMRTKRTSEYEELRQALVLGLKDFCKKIGMSKAHFGLSGGIDSALVACLAADALGAENVTSIALPGPYSSKLSFNLAKKLASNLGTPFHQVNFNNSYKSLVKDFELEFGKLSFGLVHENMQARLRGDILMAFSNFKNSLLINTSNKSELAVGYSTLYGDLCGGISPIGDLTKQQVVKLCEHYNKDEELIPRQIITRPPTAELRPNQKDSDSLPSYETLDKIVNKLVVDKKPARTATEKRVLKMLNRSEFKRWQAPPILRVSSHAFGQGRRMPIAHNAIY